MGKLNAWEIVLRGRTHTVSDFSSVGCRLYSSGKMQWGQIYFLCNGDRFIFYAMGTDLFFRPARLPSLNCNTIDLM